MWPMVIVVEDSSSDRQSSPSSMALERKSVTILCMEKGNVDNLVCAFCHFTTPLFVKERANKDGFGTRNHPV